MRRWLAALVVAGLLAVPAVASAQTPSPSPAPASSCPIPLLGAIPLVGNPVCSLVQAVPIPNPIGGIQHAAADGIHSLVRAIADAATFMLTAIVALLGQNAGVNVWSPWFVGQYGVIAAVAVVFLMWSAIVAMARAAAFGQSRDVILAGGKALWAGAIMTGPALLMVMTALAVTDWATLAVISGAGVGLQDNLHAFSDRLATIGGAGAGSGGGAIVALVIVLVAFLGALAVWINLVVRKAAILISTALIPLALAGRAHPRSEKWAKHLSTIVGAAIASKFIVAVVLSVAVAWFGNGDTADIGNDVAFGFVLIAAAFLPMLLIKAAGSVFEVRGAARMMAAKGQAAALARRPLGAARHARVLAFARTGGGAGMAGHGARRAPAAIGAGTGGSVLGAASSSSTTHWGRGPKGKGIAPKAQTTRTILPGGQGGWQTTHRWTATGRWQGATTQTWRGRQPKPPAPRPARRSPPPPKP